MASSTFKRQVNGKDIWTAPVIVTMPEREERWAIENMLRKSKVYPTFHWPRKMLNNANPLTAGIGQISPGLFIHCP
jgi:hypothetical protein